jgi:predicted PurR-regulated permease PerM
MSSRSGLARKKGGMRPAKELRGPAQPWRGASGCIVKLEAGAIADEPQFFPRRAEDRRIRLHIVFFVALVLGILTIWLTSQVLLLVFAALIVATILSAFGDLLARLPVLNRPWALRLAILMFLGLVVGVPMLFGLQAAGELDDLLRRLPELIDNAGDRLGVAGLSEQLLGAWRSAWQDGAISSIAGYTGNLVGVLSSTVLVLFGGIFIALGSEQYRNGLLRLFPRGAQGSARDVVEQSGRALRLWLLGQFLAMLVVGGVTMAGLMLMGMPSAIALGLLAGLLEFIPFVGPIFAYGVALLVALTVDLEMVFWVSLLYLALQQIESNILVPIIQKQTVSLPPALGLFSLVAVGTLFGPLGVLLAVPMTVVAIVAVKRLYIEDVLDRQSPPPDK